ncbi:MAG TPA: transporter [Burkholderiales bacterium]|nr:transporter [Burkholderiales bacterium]
MTLGRCFAAAGVWVLLLTAAAARAQHLEPRAYINTPVGMNFLIAGYTYSSGGLATDPAVPLTNAQLDIHTPFVAYARAFDAWGKSAKFDAVFAGGCLDGTADLNGARVSRDICGMLDPTMRVAVNFYGAPALEGKDFATYRQDLIIGGSLQVQAPLGQYDPTRLVNLGSNRWAFRPELGVSKVLDRRLLVEATLGVNFYTANDDFFGGQRREQDPVLATQLHFVYLFRGGSWIALDANYYSGGRTTVDGVEQNDELGNSRLGLTYSHPWDRQHSLKLYVSEGISVRYGSDFTIVGLAWQYRWGGGL